MAKPKRLPKFVKLVKPTKQVKAKFDVKTFAETAAKSAAEGNLGKFIDSSSEDGLTTFNWEANLKGYVGWRYSVTVFQIDPATEPTISEIVLVPGPESLIAPAWVPWADRLADYQALQAELEKQGELEHEEISHEIQEELAVLDFEERENAKDDAN
ncbi:MAG: DUF3027 domain-containing protein [Microbacteriaceae bacterium]|nr:DUF3027 domain-containing protein [Microbacteriaceae bacterium]